MRTKCPTTLPEALQQQREQVLMSKQLAEIAKDAPIEVNLGNWNCIRPTALRSRNFIVNWASARC